ncbi:hypothetical protein LIER_35447 [Lithospermum erythrorhizon]|uniref:Uncharacterized protein n=1 Tax=Lithospermum erythrorhizon TaxID=34254 RepID=A0AAV3NRY9_LITER
MRLPFSSFVNKLLTTMCGIEPTLSLFSALFYVSHTHFQTKFLSSRKQNILAGSRPNKVPEGRYHKKWFFAHGGMTIGVPHIWTLRDDAKSLSTPTTADMDAMAKLEANLPQKENKLHWYAFCDEAMLEISSYVAGGSKSNESDFDEMLSERPPLFTRMAITTKTKPRDSMVPESTSAAPLPSTVIVAPVVNSILKRMVKDIHASTSRPSNRLKKSLPKKKTTQVLARDSNEEVTQSLGVESQVGPVAQHAIPQQASVVDLDSSTTISDQGVAHPSEGRVSLHEELNASLPLSMRNLHLLLLRFERRFLKKAAAQYTPLKDPLATFA